MRLPLVCILLVIPSVGCTSVQLKRSTIDQASTLTELQYQQVLNNLAMFAGNMSALPYQVNLKDGSDQISDYGSASLLGAFGRSMGSLASASPGLVGSRTIVAQWGMTPVTDDTELRLLQIAYHRAFGYPDTLDRDGFANDLAHELKKQVSVTDDLKDLYSHLYKDSEMHESYEQVAPWLHCRGIQITEFDYFNRRILATNDDDIIQDGELVATPPAQGGWPEFDPARTNVIPLLTMLGVKESDLIENPECPAQPDLRHTGAFRRPTPVIQEVRRLVKETEDDLEKIHPLWFGVTCDKKAIPPDACYVGYHRDRCGEHYVWVCPGQREELSRFTLTILNLSSLLKESQIVTVPGGPRFAPSSAFMR